MADTTPVIQSDKPSIQPTGRDHSTVGTIWTAIAIFVVLLLLLLIFILQNSKSVDIHYLGISGKVGFGVAMLLSAVLGAILTLLVGSVRIIQLTRERKRHEKNT
jgi:uncharacterized integral membrane protein